MRSEAAADAAKEADATGINRKVRLAQEQMAKLIARHGKEISALTTTNEDLRRELDQRRVLEAELQLRLSAFQKFSKQGRGDVVSSEVQTESVVSSWKGWRRWIWLVTLMALGGNESSSEEMGVQTDLSLTPARAPPRTRDNSTMTAVEASTSLSDFDRWWASILDAAEEDLAADSRQQATTKYSTVTLKGPSSRMSLLQLHSLISNIYAEKIVQDELCDREGRSRMDLQAFLHLHFLEQRGSALAAKNSIIVVLGSILAHLRGHPDVNDLDGPSQKFDNLIDEYGKSGRSCVGSGRNSRIVLFARYLGGLRVDGLEPISTEGLNIYLAALARAQDGQVPLLPVNAQVSAAKFAKVLDWVFAQTRAVIRETIKIGFLDIDGGAAAVSSSSSWASGTERGKGTVDLDLALEYTVNQWADLASKADARLAALFSTVVTASDFDFDSFDEMMRKLRVDEPTLPNHGARLLLFQQLCLLPRVDSGAFARAARHAGILSVPAGPLPGIRIDADAGAVSLDALAPLYTAALRSIGPRLETLDHAGLGRGIERKWEICGELLKEREVPERAWVFYHVVTRNYTSAVRLLKQRSLATSNAGGGHTSGAPRTGPGTLEKQRSVLPASAIAAATAGTDWDEPTAFGTEVSGSTGRPAAVIAVGGGRRRVS